IPAVLRILLFQAFGSFLAVEPRRGARRIVVKVPLVESERSDSRNFDRRRLARGSGGGHDSTPSGSKGVGNSRALAWQDKEDLRCCYGIGRPFGRSSLRKSCFPSPQNQNLCVTIQGGPCPA